MSTLVRLIDETGDIGKNVYELTRIAEENRLTDYNASVRVQSWFKGHKTRSYIKHLNDCAAKIQTHWRGYLGRKYFRTKLSEMVLALKFTRFNEMATMIQKVWRGYYSRKYVFNYYARQRYLEALLYKNETIRSELNEWEEMESRRKQKENDEIMKSRIRNWAQGHHHLRGTVVIPGIYNSPYKPIPELETQLILAKPKVADSGMKNRRKKYVKYGSSEAFELNQLECLPPIHEKPQGPFRNPDEVWRQRLKPLNPTLRVQTSYTSIQEARELMRNEEWAQRLFDEKLIPFTHPPEKPYQSLLHSSSQYGQIPYGTAYFREEKPERFILAHNPKHFNTVVPPVEVFDKVNDVY